jgi:hypothetical protein
MAKIESGKSETDELKQMSLIPADLPRFGKLEFV